MNRGILLLNVGVRCTVRLVCSLWSLRKHYSGPVCLLNARGTDDGITEKIAADDRLGVSLKQIDIEIFRRRTAYVAKPSVYRWTPFDRTLFVDADTIFAGDPSPIFDVANPFVVTQFSDWHCGGSIIRKRVANFLSIECPPLNVPNLARFCIAERWPAINTGVFVFDKRWAGMQTWEQLTKAARRKANFTDEIAAQVLLPVLDHAIAGEQFNASPLYHRCPADEVVIWHFHGSKHVRPEALPIWWPVYQECMELNIGGIRGFTPAADKRLTSYLEQQPKEPRHETREFHTSNSPERTEVA